YMLQCGLLVPMDKDSKTGIFNHLFIHMGDDQSIDNDLSTYSSHLVNMKYFTRHADEKTLILIDEFGTGTEPLLGGAIAESILAKLNETGAYGVVTTHYTNLKHFAASTDGIENGAMLFDNHLMEPLFRLEIGKPGSSFAFEIARKIGLPENILDEAQKKVGKEHIDFDKHLKDVVRDKRYWERKRDSIRISEKKLEEIVEKYSDELDSIKKFRKEIIEKAKLEAEELLKKANRRIENTIREIKEARAEKEKTREIRKKLDEFKDKAITQKTGTEKEFEKRLEQVRKQQKYLQTRRPDIIKDPEKKKPVTEKQVISKGDKVKMTGMDKTGEVIEVGSKNVIVLFGNMITTVDIGKIQKTGGDDTVKTSDQTNSTGFMHELHKRKLNFKPEIDIRGQRGDEALQTVTNFIDEAIMVDEKEVRILHGKGDGILRQLVREWLQANDMVNKYHDEHIERGGTGITVVELDM
ncbi:MAG: Smr/MutS family protein, partial [Bacteroidetes bacterium]|nr:Smr/MutS family protein [Bacteroidota bacterium]